VSVVVSSRNSRAGAKRSGPEGAALTARAAKERVAHTDAAPSAVAEIQRQRILRATAEVAAEHGAGEVTVAHIVERAGVSRRTFYELFGDREECFLAALDEAVERAAAVVLPAYEGAAGWRERIRAGLAALLRFLDDEPGTRALLAVEALGAGPRALAHRARVVDALIAAVDEGRLEGRGASAPPLAAEGVVGAVLAVIHARVSAGMGALVAGMATAAQRQSGTALLSDLFGALMGMIVLPYLGASAARKESERAAPGGAVERRAHSGNPLEGLKMRLTYRTLCVLRAIARHPDSSNRDIGAVAGMTDQGQISKLLARLEGLGLIANVGAGHIKGASNAWRLTERGEQVEHSLRG
jgi:AcrR family transcriptional regulator